MALNSCSVHCWTRQGWHAITHTHTLSLSLSLSLSFSLCVRSRQSDNSLGQFEFVRNLSPLDPINGANIDGSLHKLLTVLTIGSSTTSPLPSKETTPNAGTPTLALEFDFTGRDVECEFVIRQSQEGLSHTPVYKDPQDLDAFQQGGWDRYIAKSVAERKARIVLLVIAAVGRRHGRSAGSSWRPGWWEPATVAGAVAL